MKRIFFIIMIGLAALCLVLAVYYSIPGVPHPFFLLKGGFAIVNPFQQPKAGGFTHHKYTAVLLGVAVLLGLVAYLFRGKKASVSAA